MIAGRAVGAGTVVEDTAVDDTAVDTDALVLPGLLVKTTRTTIGVAEATGGDAAAGADLAPPAMDAASTSAALTLRLAANIRPPAAAWDRLPFRAPVKGDVF